MKKVVLTTVSLIALGTSAWAQCSDVKNNFEMKLATLPNNQIQVQVRNHANAVEGATNVVPSKKIALDGLVFAITWPTTSNVSLQSSKTILQPFNLVQDVQQVQNKVASDNYATFYHESATGMPVAFDATWENDKWYTLATFTYSGTLAKNDYFSFMTCDYGLAHPNSYYGNSSTDPWFAVLDANNTYNQFSPKMITELPTTTDNNTVKMYPVPTNGDLTIDVTASAAMQTVAKVTDLQGKVVKTIHFELSKGLNTNTINIGELPVGEYLIQVTDGKAFNYSQIISKN